MRTSMSQRVLTDETTCNVINTEDPQGDTDEKASNMEDKGKLQFAYDLIVQNILIIHFFYLSHPGLDPGLLIDEVST